jgi:hypothetical protein
MYTVIDCGWVIRKSICDFNNRTIGGKGHTLELKNEGARRLGPNLLFMGSSFSNAFGSKNTYYPPFYVSNLEISVYISFSARSVS